jgi:hypothetical protein
LARLEFEPREDGSRIVPAEFRDPAARHEHGRALVDDLQQVEIARDNVDPLAGIDRLPRERGDHVVGLFAFHLKLGDSEDVEDAPDQCELRAQIVRHRFAMRFVIPIERYARVRQALIECRNHVRGLFVGDQLRQHLRETVSRVDRHAFGRRQHGQSEERAIHEPVRIEQHQDGLVLRGRAHENRSAVESALIRPQRRLRPHRRRRLRRS